MDCRLQLVFLLLSPSVVFCSTGGGLAPEFIEEPRDLYVGRSGSSTTITCRARGALRLSVACHPPVKSRPIPQDFVEPEAGVRHSELYLEVTRADLEGHRGHTSCFCEAWSSAGGAVRSRNATVRVSYLKKTFALQPSDSFVPLYAPLKLECRPPDGDPAPTVEWLKDGNPVPPQSALVTSAGSLVFQRVGLADQGKYLCQARNHAGIRVSDPAVLKVFVDGGWTSWSPWTPCSTSCGKGQKVRTRECSNPAPLNGGQLCMGKSTQNAACEVSCTAVDGQWSEWSNWSACRSDCQQIRRRTCDSPTPVFGGATCVGPAISTANCTGGHCQVVKLERFQGQVVLGFIISIILFIIIVCITLGWYYLHRRHINKPGHCMAFDPELSSRVGKYEEKPPLEDYEPLLPTAWRLKETVCPGGSRLVFPETGIYLTVPPGAYKTSQDVYLDIHFGEKAEPFNSSINREEELVVSPIVEVGPGEMEPCKPLVISMDHSLIGSRWDVAVMAAPISPGTPRWRRALQLGKDTTVSPPVFCQLDRRRAHLMVEHPGRYGLVARPASSNPAARLALTLCPFLSSCRTLLRVYHCPDLPASVMEIRRRELLAGSTELHYPASFVYNCYDRASISFELEVDNNRCPMSLSTPLGPSQLPCSTFPLPPLSPPRFTALLRVYQAGEGSHEVDLSLSCPLT